MRVRAKVEEMAQICMHMYASKPFTSAIDHRTWKTGLPVRSAVLKPCAGRLVVGWVTTSEYLLLIVLLFFPFSPFLFLQARRAMVLTTHETLPDGELPLLAEFP
jgi:hypothetical protein